MACGQTKRRPAAMRRAAQFSNFEPSVLRRRRRIARAIAAVGHELVELGLVLGKTQALQKGVELALLVFQPAQRVFSVFIERTVAARSRRLPPRPSATHAFTSVWTAAI